ncbi:MAG: MBL fold metallo-hydrolase, partial [bacterium]
MSESASPMLTRDPMTAKYRSWAPAHQVAPDVWMHAAFVNTYAIRTDAGLVLVDPGLRPLSQSVRDGLREWSDALLHTAVYTHGHVDHAFGLRAFLEAGERPNIVAQANLPARFRRYALT